MLSDPDDTVNMAMGPGKETPQIRRQYLGKILEFDICVIVDTHTHTHMSLCMCVSGLCIGPGPLRVLNPQVFKSLIYNGVVFAYDSEAKESLIL